MLLLGTPPKRLERDLKAAGHRVDTAATPAQAKPKQYAVVITDSSMQNDARANFTKSVVIVRNDDVAMNLRQIENQVGRKPTAVAGREVIAAGEKRVPVAAGPSAEERGKPQRVASKEPSTEPETGPTPPAAARTPTPAARTATTATTATAKAPAVTPKPAEKAPPEKTVAVADKPHTDTPAKTGNDHTQTTTTPVHNETKPAHVDTPTKPDTVTAAVPTKLDVELYFGLGSASASGNPASIAKALKFLKANTDAGVVIEGYADPTGTPEDNLALSQRRAEWVRDRLVADGIDASRLEVMAYGDTRLKYGSADHRNRRVAIVKK